MTKKIRVLVFPAGEINSIELHDALSSNVNVELFGASSVERHGAFVFKNYISGLPAIQSPQFLSKFNALLKKLKIDLIFPTHDSVVLYLAENQEKLSAKTIVPNLDTAKICRDKRATYEFFRDADFCPEIYEAPQVFPCVIKPCLGQGAKGVQFLSKEEDIPVDINWAEYVTTEYLPGKELTVDCLTDSHGKLCAVLPRSRERVMAGVSVAGKAITADEEVKNIAEQINQRLNFLGLWYFQLKEDKNGNYKLLEVSARCAGTMCLSRGRGINLPLLSVYAAMGREISVCENAWGLQMDRMMISRYRLDYDYQNVYIDYDDTVIINNEVCLPIIRFLYQCRNAGKQVILLTRHEDTHSTTIGEDMANFSIPPSIFHNIVLLRSHESKVKYIDAVGSVFIDNSYAERKEVSERLHIPVFDVDGVEVLADWRC